MRCCHCFIANLSLSPLVNKCENRSKFGEVIDKKKNVILTRGVVYKCSKHINDKVDIHIHTEKENKIKKNTAYEIITQYTLTHILSHTKKKELKNNEIKIKVDVIN